MTIRYGVRHAAILMAMLVFCPLGVAAANETPALTDPVTADSPMTYLDLARAFVPDLAAAEGGFRGDRPVLLRHLAGDGFRQTEPQPVGLYAPSVTRIRADGQEYLAVLFDFGAMSEAAQGFAVLAYYTLGNKPQLVDAADIGLDRMTSFADVPPIALSGDSQALVTQSSHFNSNQTYKSLALSMLNHGRLALIDQIFLFDERLCAMNRTQEASFAATPSTQGAQIIVTVTDRIEPTGETCDDSPAPEASTRTIRVAYDRDPATGLYRPDSDAFKRLATDNESRF